jgi:molecular chaperone Hsp33
MSKVLIGMDRSKSFRVYLTLSTNIVEEARKIHETSPTGTALLGRVLTATALMGIMMKGDKSKITLQFKGDGEAREVLATANAKGDVKGYISNGQIYPPPKKNGKMDVGAGLDIGMLTVIKDFGMKEPYIGKLALVSGEIADDLTAYFFISEQQSTSVALSEKINQDGSVAFALGLIIQMLPDSRQEVVTELELILDNLPPFSELVEEVMKESKLKSDEGILKALSERIFGIIDTEYKVEVLEFKEIHWNCDCSNERLEKVVMSIGAKDLSQIIEEDGQAELVCQFCTKKYHFDKEHLERLLIESQNV